MFKKDEGESTAFLVGFQLAIFEVIWGNYDWIQRVFVRMAIRMLRFVLNASAYHPMSSG